MELLYNHYKLPYDIGNWGVKTLLIGVRSPFITIVEGPPCTTSNETNHRPVNPQTKKPRQPTELSMQPTILFFS